MNTKLLVPLAERSTAERAAVIRGLNDTLRREGAGGWTMVTAGVNALPQDTRERVLAAVKGFDAFDAANDPFEEHDFGAIRVDGIVVMFKIDYYDQSLERASLDPTDSDLTRRLLTLMLGSEY